MSYKRVVKRKGKSYGPYIYESYRDENGKSQKRYIGKVEEKKSSRTLFFLIGFLALALLVGGCYTTDLLLNQGEVSENVFVSVGSVFSGVFDGVTGLVVSEESSEDSSESGDSGSSSSESSSESSSSESSSEAPVEEAPAEETTEEAEETTEEAPAEEVVEEETTEEETVEEPIFEEEVNETVEEEPAEEEPIEEVNETIVPETNETVVENVTEETTEEETVEEPIEEVNETIVPEINETVEEPIEEIIPEANVTVNETLVEEVNETITIDLNETIIVELNETLNETIDLNETFIVNATIANASTLQYRAVIHRPVKWIKKVNVSGGNVTVELPKDAENISILTGEEVEEAIDEFDDFEGLVEETDREELFERSLITGNVAFDISRGDGWLIRFWNWLTGFTISGNVILEEEIAEDIIDTENSTLVGISDLVSGDGEFAVEYYTEAPQSNETNLSNGKRIVVHAPDELNYTEILSYTMVDEMGIQMNDSRMKLYWYASVEDAVAAGYMNASNETVSNRSVVENVTVELNETVIEIEENVTKTIDLNETVEIEENVTEVVNETVIEENVTVESVESEVNETIVEEIVVADNVTEEKVKKEKKEKSNNGNGKKTLLTGAVVFGAGENESYEERRVNILEQEVAGLLNGSVALNEIKIEVDYVSHDFDEDGFVDYIEWVVPHLSAQVYQIIVTDISEESIFLLDNVVAENNFTRLNLSLGEPYFTAAASSSIGDILPQTGNNGTIYTGTEVWANSGNIVDEVNLATVYLWAFKDSDDLRASNFDFSAIPSDATITGIEVIVNGLCLTSDVIDQTVKLVDADGNAVGDDKSTGTGWGPLFYSDKTFGGSTDMWGTSLTVANIQDSDFGAYYVGGFTGINAGGTLNIKYIKMKVYYTTPSKENLLLYLPFDTNTSATTVYDYSRFENDGTLTGNAQYISSGKYSGGLDFSDSGNVSGFNQLLNTGETNMTFGGWVRYDSIANDGSTFDVIMHHSDTGDLGPQLYSYNSGGTSVKCYSTDKAAGFNSPVLDTWYHIMCRWNGTHVAMFVNGELNASNTMGVGIQAGSQFQIGKMYGDYQFNGTLDEVMVFNKSLTAVEISNIYSNTSERFKSSGTQTLNFRNISVGNSNINLTAGFQSEMDSSIGARVGYWDSTKGYKDYDLGEHALELDGAGDYVKVACDGFNWSTFETVSASAWIYPKTFDFGGDGSAYIFEQGEVYAFFGLDETTGYLRAQMASLSDPQISSTTAPTLNAWNYVTYVYNGTHNELFLNGVSIDVEPTTGTPGYRCDPGYPLNIGAHGNGAIRQFNGSIDEVMIFNDSLTAVEISNLYNLGRDFGYYDDDNLVSRWNFNLGDANDTTGSNNGTLEGTASISGNTGLVAYWNFDESVWEGGISDVIDSVGSNNGNATGNANTTSDAKMFGRVGTFDGDGDYVDVGDDDLINFSSDDAFSYFAWVRPADTDRGVILGDWDGVDYNAIGLEFDDRDVGGQNSFRVWLQASSTNYKEYVLRRDYQIDTWYFLGFTYDNNVLTLYENGISYTPTKDRDDTLSGNMNNDDNPRIGKDNRASAGATEFNGSIDEVMIFNRSLSAQEIKELYIEGRVKWDYAPFQTLTSYASEKSFAVDTTSTHILPDFRFVPGNSSAYPFYSPVLQSISTSGIQQNMVGNLTDIDAPNLTINKPLSSTHYSSSNLWVNASAIDAWNNVSLVHAYGLVGWWRMDDSNSTHVYDYLGKLNGTIVNNAIQNSSGYMGSAFTFDGENDYINLGTSSDFKITNKTVSFWANPKCGSGLHQMPFASGENYYTSFYNVCGSNTFYFSNSNITGSQDSVGLSSVIIPNEWHYYTAVWNVSGMNVNRTVYVDGVLSKTNLNTEGHGDNYGSTMTIGGLGSSYDFNGSIDDVMFFNRSLAPVEIRALYANSTSKFLNETMPLPDSSFNSGYYAQDAAGNVAGSVISDIIIDTVFPASTYTEGTSADGLLTVGDSLLVNVSTVDANPVSTVVDLDSSLVSWWRFDDLGSYGETTNDGTSDAVGCDSGTTDNALGLSSVGLLSPGDTIRFTEGVESGNTFTVSSCQGFGCWPATSDCCQLTGWTDCGGAWDPGFTDEFEINPVTISVTNSSEIADYIGLNNGTAVDNATQTEAGKFGKGFEFDGDEDYLVVPYSDSINFTELNNASFSMWVYPKHVGWESGRMGLIGDATTRDGFILWSSLGSIMYFGDVIGDGYYSVDITDLQLNQWKHLVVNYYWNGTEVLLDVYLDGVADVVGVATGEGRIISSGGLKIGQDNNRDWNGTMDDILIFNRSLSASEIAALYADASTEYKEVNFTGLSDGAHTFKAYTQDLSGNLNDTLETRTVTTDATVPNVTINLPENNTHYDGTTVKINASAMDPEQSVSLFNDYGLVSWWRMDDPGLTNLSGNAALGKTTVNSSWWGTSWPPSKVVDGSLTTYWISGGGASEWLYIDLNDSYYVRDVDLYWYPTVNYSGDYIIQVSDDTISWTNVTDVINGVQGWQNNTLENPAKGRYVRMYGISKYQANFWVLEEIVVYLSSGSNYSIAKDYIAGNDAVAVGNASQTSSGKMGKAFTFDGDGDSLEISQPAIQTYPNLFTISGWINPKNQAARFLTPQSNGIDQYLIYDNSNQRLGIEIAEKADVNGRTRYSSTGSVPLDVWTHWSVSIDDDEIRIHINGSADNNYTETIEIANWSGDWVIGERGNGQYPFNGSLDDLMVWNRTLSDAEIQAMYANATTKYLNSSITVPEGTHDITYYSQDTSGNLGMSTASGIIVDTTNPSAVYGTGTESDAEVRGEDYVVVNVSFSDTNYVSTITNFDNSLVGWWRMDDSNVTGNPQDYFGVYNATYLIEGSGAGSIVDVGYLGKGLKLSSVDNENGAGLDTGDKFDVNGSDSMTLVYWINTQLINEAYIGNMRWNGLSGYVINPNNGQWRVGNGTHQQSWDSTTDASLGNWKMVAVGINSTHLVSYADGAYVTSGVRTISGNIGTGAATLKIGRDATSTSYYFNGTIDDVIIFNRSLSADEIRALYSNTSTGYNTINYSGLADGDHTFRAYTQDLSGNMNASLETRTVSVDNTDPVLIVNRPENGTHYNSTSVWINSSASDASNNISIFNDYGLVSWWRMDDTSSSLTCSAATQTCDSTCTDIFEVVSAPLKDFTYATTGSSCTIGLANGVCNSTDASTHQYRIHTDAGCDAISGLIAGNGECAEFMDNVMWDHYVCPSMERKGGVVTSADCITTGWCGMMFNRNFNDLFDFTNEFFAGGGGNPADYLGINNGTLVDNASQTDFGKLGKGMTFDGDGDCLDIDISGGIENLADSSFSISFWTKTSNYDEYLISFRGATTQQMINFATQDLGTNSLDMEIGKRRDICYGALPYDGNWHHTTVVVNYTNENYYNTSVYSDGVIKCDDTFNWGTGDYNLSGPHTSIGIGGDANNGCYGDIEGSIDDVLIFNRSLSAAEIAGIYANNSAKFLNTTMTAVEGTSDITYYAQDLAGNLDSITSHEIIIDTIFPNATYAGGTTANNDIQLDTHIFVNVSTGDVNNVSTVVNLDNSLVSWWTMDNVDAVGDPQDSIGPNHGLIYGDARQTDAGKLGKGFLFDGGDYINFTDAQQTICDGCNFTIMSWIKPSASVTGSNVDIFGMSDGGSGSYRAYSLMMSSGTNSYALVGNSTATVQDTCGALTVNQWSHVVSRFNGTHILCYINGVAGGSPVLNTLTGTVPQRKSGSTEVMGAGYEGSLGNLFLGTLDDVMVFNRSLSTTEIQAIYANSSSGFTEINYTGLAEGEHSFKAYTQDLSGNINDTLETRAVTLESTALTVCRSLNISNTTYTLQNDITGITGDCFVIAANNITIDMGGFNITGDGSGDEGVENLIGYDNLTVQNGEIYDFGTGIYSLGDSGNFINLTLSLNDRAVYLKSNSANFLSNITATSSLYRAIRLHDSSNNNLTGLNLTQNLAGGIIVYGTSSNNIFTNISSNNNINYGIWFFGGSNNNVTNSNLSGNSLYDVFSSLSATSNILLNVSYNNESVASGSSLTRKWYYQAYVNDTAGNPVIANVSAYNRTGAQEFSISTNSTGWTNKTAITEYVNTGTPSYASYYTINASNSSYQVNNQLYNVTVNTNKLDNSFLMVEGADPVLTVNRPVNGSHFDSTSVWMNASGVDASSNVSLSTDYGLVSWWRMDDINSTGHPTDYMGRNNGTVNENAVQTDYGKLGKGFSLDGVDDNANSDYIITGTTNLPSGTANRTVSLWLKWDASDSTDVIFGYGNGADGNMSGFFVDSSDNLWFWGYNTGGFNEDFDTGYNIVPGEWTQVAFTYNGTHVDTYADGALKDSRAWDIFTVIDSSTIGFNQYTNNNPFDGTIDDLMIYNRSLSAEEIQALYANSTTNYINASITFPEGNYNFNYYAQDAAGNIVSSAVSSIIVDATFPGVSYASNTDANGLSKGVDNVFVNVSASDGGNVSTVINFDNSLVSWWRMDDVAAAGGNATDYLFDNTDCLDIDSETILTPSTDQRCDVYKYIDVDAGPHGMCNDTESTDFAGTDCSPSDGRIYVGTKGFFGVGGGLCAAPKTVVCCKSNESKYAKVMWNATTSCGPGANLDWEVTYVTATVDDYIGSNNGAPIADAILTDAGKLGKGYEFDGAGDYITVEDSPGISGGHDLTVSAWFKLNINASESGTQYVMTKYEDTYDKDYGIVVNTADAIYFSYENGHTGGCNNPPSLRIGENIVKDIWYQVSFTYDQSDHSIKTYLNGNLSNQTTTMNNCDLHDGVQSLALGSMNPDSSYGEKDYLNGTIDDVMIFNRTLSDEEVLGLYGNSSSRFTTANFTDLADGPHTFKAYTQDLSGNLNASLETRTVTTDGVAPIITINLPENNTHYNSTTVKLNASSTDLFSNVSLFNSYGLVSWWRMDEANSTHVLDYLGRDNGTIVGNPVQIDPGYFGKGLDMDGSADGFTTGDLGVPANGNATISLWVYLHQNATDFGQEMVFLTNASYSTTLQYSKANNFIYGPSCYFSNSQPTVNSWNHLVLTYSGDSSTSLLYLNGVPHSPTWVGGHWADFPALNNSKVGTRISTQSINGTLDDIMIFNRTLSIGEVQALYANSTTKYLNSSMTVSEGTHDFSYYSQDLAGNVVSSVASDIVVDLTFPGAAYGAGTDTTSTKPVDHLFVNVTTSDTHNVSTLIDFDNSLVSWWRFDDVEGTKVVDFTGKNNGTSSGNAAQVDAGRIGKGFAFDGSNDLITVGDSPSFDSITNEITVSYWQKVNNLASNFDTVLSKGNGDAGWPGSTTTFTLFNYWSSNEIAFAINNGSHYDSIKIEPLPSSDVWHHIVFTFNGSEYNSYLDGILNQSDPDGVNGYGLNSMVSNDYSLIIGDVTSYQFNGTMDDMMIFNRSLSAAEVQALYANSSSGYKAVNYTSLSNGAHTFRAYTQDLAGNVNDSLETRTVTIDTGVPVVSIVYPTATTYPNYVTYLNYTVADADDSCWYSTNNSANSSAVSVGVNWTGLTGNSSLGANKWDVWCNDTAGNLGVASVTFTVDDVVPGAVYAGGTDATGSAKDSNSIFVNISASDATGNVSSFVDFDSSLVSWWRMDDLGLGSEKVTNGGFTNTVIPWRVDGGPGWFEGAGAVDYYGNDDWGMWDLSQDVGIVAGRTYNVTFNVKQYYTGNGYLAADLGGQDILISSGGIKSSLVVAGSSDSNITFTAYDGGDYLEYYSIDDVSVREVNASVADYMGRNDGTAVGNASQTDEGKLGKAFEFDGAGDYINVDYNESINFSLTDNFTYSMWHYNPSGSGDSWKGFIGSNSLSDHEGGYLFYHAGGQLSWYQDYDAPTAYLWYSGLNLGDEISYDAWHQIVFRYHSYNGTHANITFYVDGGTFASTTLFALSPTGNTILIEEIGGGAGNRYFNGSLDDVMIFNRSLSAAEIQALYSNSSSKYSEITFANITDGFHTFRAYVQDSAGNLNSSLETRTVTTDITMPDDPIPVLNFTGIENLTSENILCSSTLADVDGGPLNVSVDWYLNGELNLSHDYNESYLNGTNFSAILAPGNTTKHDNWACAMRTTDGIQFSNWVNVTYNVTVLNDIPVVTLTAPANWSSITNRTPEFSWTVSDDDGDTMTYDWNLTSVYFGGGGTCSDPDKYETMASNTYVPASELGCLYDNSYYYTWRVRANDSEGYGDWSSDFAFNITADMSISLLDVSMNFGSMSPNEINDTADDAPEPFVISNDGTVLLNVSVNAPALWNLAPTDSEYYQFKVDNYSFEENAFNPLRSIISWFNVPITGSVVAINELNYTDGKDSAEVDIRVQVPPNEAPNAKSSLIVFTSRLAQ